MDKEKPKIFISHSFKDNKISKKIADSLKKDNADVWIDDLDIKPGEPCSKSIEEALKQCDALVLIWSKSAAKSRYVQLEWQNAFNLKKKIITCLIDDIEIPAILHDTIIDFKNFEKGYEELIQALNLIIKKENQAEKREWSSKIKEEIEKLPFGQFLFNIPKLMKIGKKERIEVRISQDLETDITKKLKGKGTPEIEISKVGNFMKVRLSGDNFKIGALNEEEQIVGEDTFTEWAWDVVPLKSKIQVLHFHVTIRLKIEGTEEKRDYPVIDKEVYVKVNPVYSTKVFAVNNWKWILTALLIPLAGWIVRMVLVK